MPALRVLFEVRERVDVLVPKWVGVRQASGEGGLSLLLHIRADEFLGVNGNSVFI